MLVEREQRDVGEGKRRERKDLENE